VYPAALIWPASLASTVVFRALHEPKQDNSPANGWTITRYRFFAYFTAFAFVLFWFPDYIWTSLGTFAFFTWIWPHNQKVNTIFGVSCGFRTECDGAANLYADELRLGTTPSQYRLDANHLCKPLSSHDALLHCLQCFRRRRDFLHLLVPNSVLHQCLEQRIVSDVSLLPLKVLYLLNLQD